MRYRRVKFEGEKLEVIERCTTQNAKENKGNWNVFFGNNHPIYLEMGCGKGKFITDLAKANPDNNYIGVEGQEGVVLRAAQKAYNEDIKNVTFICEFIQDLDEYFSENEIEGLYLNFSDPWPKARHAKRRLTHHNYLNKYRKMIKENGIIEFKTDNDSLFTFSVEEFKEYDFDILALSYDLYGSEYEEAKKFTTEYEEKFKEWGNSIKYLKARSTHQIPRQQ